MYIFSYKLIIWVRRICSVQNLELSLIVNYFWLLLFRLQELTVCSEDNVDVHDIELLQYINVDCAKLKRLLKGKFKCKIYLKLIKVSEKLVFECMNCPNCVEVEHQSGFYNANVLVKRIMMFNDSITFEP